MKMFFSSLKQGVVAAGSIVQETGVFVTNMSKAAKDLKGKRIKLVVGPKHVIVGLFLVSVFLSLASLFTFNQMATKGYELNRLEAKRQELMTQYEIKNMKLAEVKSLTNIIETERAGVMRRPSDITYISGNTFIAKK
jgi:hypothetical protein